MGLINIEHCVITGEVNCRKGYMWLGDVALVMLIGRALLTTYTRVWHVELQHSALGFEKPALTGCHSRGNDSNSPATFSFFIRSFS